MADIFICKVMRRGSILYQGVCGKMKKLKTVNERNGEAFKFSVFPCVIKSGTACPKCGKEMLENVSICLTSCPPQHYVSCPDCGYTGTVFY